MKKILSLELILLFLFFACGAAHCEDGFYIGTPYDDTKNKMSFPVSNSIQEAKPVQNQQTEEKKGFFSKFFKSNKPKKQTRFNPATNRTEEIPQGYYGTLPDIGQDFKYKQQTSSTPTQPDAYIPDEKIQDENLKPAPFDDTLFLDVIVKKEKSSNYVNDIQKTKFALNNLKKCIEEKGDIQRFNGCVNMVDLYSQNLQKKYENKSDALRESYVDILNTNYYAKVLGNLLYDANYYARYVPTQQGKYSKENIEAQKQDLLKRINKTLFLIANET
ncbi:MAG: hypothetical protein IJ877_00010 [Candidatus Gastranaerophilales bacterium]|nr:hypothetical protein [Candidatus Gastranaerophilales bacterium]